MTKVVANALMSLDGFIAGPHQEMDWVFDHGFLPEAPSDVVTAIIENTGAILSGRASYDVGASGAREETSSAFEGQWTGPQFVLTHRPPEDAVPGVQFLSGDVRAAVATTLAAAQGKDALVLGANVTQQCLALDLIDEIVVLVVPITLGDGVRLFGRATFRETMFETVDVSRLGEAAVLHVRRRR